MAVLTNRASTAVSQETGKENSPARCNADVGFDPIEHAYELRVIRDLCGVDAQALESSSPIGPARSLCEDDRLIAYANNRIRRGDRDTIHPANDLGGDEHLGKQGVVVVGDAAPHTDRVRRGIEH